MDKLRNPKVQGALRHLLTAIGPVLALLAAVEEPLAFVASLIRPENWPALVGVLMAVLGFWASWAAPEKAE